MVIRCDWAAKRCVVRDTSAINWLKMPADIVSFAVSTGFGVSVLAGIISGVCYVVSQGLQKKRSQKAGREWHCAVCSRYLRSIEGVLEGDRVVSCGKCTGRVCKNRCSVFCAEDGLWLCAACAKTPESWYSTVLNILQPIKGTFGWRQEMEGDSLTRLEDELKTMRDKERAEIRDFMERLVNAMLGENVDDACVSKMYQDKPYLPITGQSPCTAHTLLKQLIHRLIRDSQDIPNLVRPESALSSTSVPSTAEKDKTYEDLLATAIINKVISNCQTRLPSSSANSVSSRLSNSSKNQDDKQYYFGEETLDSKWKTTDLDTTSVSSLEEWLHNNETQMGQKYVDKVTLTIKQNIEDVAQTDSDQEPEDDRDYFQNQSLLNEDDTNWFLQKRQFQGTHSPVPVPMLVPDPTGDAKVLIGDTEVDDTSDLSDIASDYGDTEIAPVVENLIVNSKTVIGGKNMLESLTMGSDGELSADSGVREEKDFDEFGSNSLIHEEEPIVVVEAVNPSKDISVDDDNIEDESLISTYSNTEQDTEYTERYASLPRRIEKPQPKPRKPINTLDTDEEDEIDSKEFNGSYSKKEREKWKNAVQMDNNPYSKENIEKRLQSSNSSVSSLFGADYYKRQASNPTGTKTKGENKDDLWTSRMVQVHSNESDSDQSLNNYREQEQKPEVNKEEEENKEEELDSFTQESEEDVNESKVTDQTNSEVSDSDLSFNVYDVSNSTIHQQHSSGLNNNEPPKIYQLKTIIPEQPKEVVTRRAVSPSFVELDVNHNVPSLPVLRPRPKSLHVQTSQSLYDVVPNVMRRKKDNTLIDKIYQDMRVKKSGLSRTTSEDYGSITPQTPKTPLTPVTPKSPTTPVTFLNSITPASPLKSPRTPQSTPLTPNPSITPKWNVQRTFELPVQSVGHKVEVFDGFEIQEVQTNMLYSSEDSGDFRPKIERSSSSDTLDRHSGESESEDSSKKGMLHKKRDSMINELSSLALVSTRLKKFKSSPSLNRLSDIDVPRNKIDDDWQAGQSLNVQRLKKMYDKLDESSRVVYSITARKRPPK